MNPGTKTGFAIIILTAAALAFSGTFLFAQEKVWSALGEGISGEVFALARDPAAGSLYAGGNFDSAGGVLAQNIARWDGNSWAPLGEGVVGNVFALAWDGEGSLYVGGEIDTAEGLPVNNIARWDAGAETWHPLGEGIAGGVQALAWDGEGNLYAGGHFHQAGEVEVNNIARWDAGEETWHPLGEEWGDGYIYALAWDGVGGNLYAGGHFHLAVGGGSNNIARWDAGEETWHPLGEGIDDDYISALAWDGVGGNLYAGGHFHQAGGVEVNHIARWDTGEETWHPLGEGFKEAEMVSALAWDGDGENLYAGGYLKDMEMNNIAQWDAGEQSWNSLGEGIEGGVNALARDDGEETLYAGGLFAGAGGVEVHNIAQWADPLVLTMLEPDGVGTVEPGVGEHFYPPGRNVHLTALPGLGWEFSRWTGEVENTEAAVTSIFMDGDKEVGAFFAEYEGFELPFPEDFSGIPEGEIPRYWTRDNDNWSVRDSSEAGGEPPEMVFLGSGEQPLGEYYLFSPKIDTTGRDRLIFSLKHTLRPRHLPEPYTVRIVAFSNGTEYTIGEWTERDTIRAEEFETVLTSDEHGVGSGEFYLAWVFEGDPKHIESWSFDDVFLGDPSVLTVENPEGSGTVIPAPGEYLFKPDANVELAAVAGLGWEFSHWTGEVEDPSSAATFVVMDIDRTVRAFFTEYEAYVIPFSEAFDETPEGEVPARWARDFAALENWGVFDTSIAGGEAPEMRFFRYPPVEGEFYLVSPRIDTAGLGELIFSFKYYLNNSGLPGPYTLRAVTISGAEGTERTVGEWVNPDSIPTSEFWALLTEEHGVGSDEFYLAWVFDGHSEGINWWHLDDIRLEVPPPPPSPTPTPSVTPTAAPLRTPTPSVTPTASPPPTPDPLPYLVLGGGDYTGDGLSDIAIFRPESGLWAVRGLERVYFGREGDIPVPGDYEGDGVTNIAVYRPASGLWAAKGITRFYFGGGDLNSGSLPVPADYTGDGWTDPGIFNPASGLWAIRDLTRVHFGAAGDLPVPADYNRDGFDEFAIFRPATGLWAVRGLTRVYFGREGDIPVPGKYTWYGPDGLPFQIRFAVFRPATGLWAVRGATRYYFGREGDYPVPGDYSGNFKAEIAVFRGLTGLWAVRETSRVYWGAGGDFPVAR